MDHALTNPPAGVHRSTKALRIGCVSFLNARPLIDGLDGGVDPQVTFDVPSGLLTDLESGAVDVALCPVIDQQRSRVPLEILPVGGIGCDGPTLTVRLYSQAPIDRITDVYVDTDSHTSVVLLRVLLAEQFGLRPRLVHFNPRDKTSRRGEPIEPPAMLLIGDKVVTAAPTADRYPHQLDLGEAWRDLTGLPFVFAVWMTRAGAVLGDLPARLNQVRLENVAHIDRLVDRHAAAHGWPRELAARYLGEWLKYDIGPRQLQAIQLFFAKALDLGAIETLRPAAVRSAPQGV